MKKVFISQPMANKTLEEIKTERSRIEKEIKAFFPDVEFIDSIFDTYPGLVNAPLWCLAKALELLSYADLVYFAEGWEKARGCVIEHKCAVDYGIKIIGGN